MTSAWVKAGVIIALITLVLGGMSSLVYCVWKLATVSGQVQSLVDAVPERRIWEQQMGQKMSDMSNDVSTLKYEYANDHTWLMNLSRDFDAHLSHSPISRAEPKPDPYANR